MTLYLDTNVLVAVVIQDRLSVRAYAFLRDNPSVLLTSDYAAAEFASAVAMRMRTGGLTQDAARRAFIEFDNLSPGMISCVETTARDIRQAEAFIRRLDLNLRAPDALNIAIANRVGATLMTFDEKMAIAAKALGVAVASA